jgi:ferredoxin-fold anticodon binding domain-containing protein
MSMLSAFTTQLVNFFEDLSIAFPEERDIKLALEAVKGAKKVNPRLILDLYYEHVYKDLSNAIANRDIVTIRAIAQHKISNQFNEMISALAIFDKHWDSMGTNNQETIWKYLTVLSVLCEKARARD